MKINLCYLEVTGVDVAQDDEDLTKICSSCLGDLKFSFLFKKKCVEAAKSFDEDDKEIGKAQKQDLHVRRVMNINRKL